jgi:hypothetical protein
MRKIRMSIRKEKKMNNKIVFLSFSKNTKKGRIKTTKSGLKRKDKEREKLRIR